MRDLGVNLGEGGHAHPIAGGAHPQSVQRLLYIFGFLSCLRFIFYARTTYIAGCGVTTFGLYFSFQSTWDIFFYPFYYSSILVLRTKKGDAVRWTFPYYLSLARVFYLLILYTYLYRCVLDFYLFLWWRLLGGILSLFFSGGGEKGREPSLGGKIFDGGKLKPVEVASRYTPVRMGLKDRHISLCVAGEACLFVAFLNPPRLPWCLVV